MLHPETASQYDATRMRHEFREPIAYLGQAAVLRDPVSSMGHRLHSPVAYRLGNWWQIGFLPRSRWAFNTPILQSFLYQESGILYAVDRSRFL